MLRVGSLEIQRMYLMLIKLTDRGPRKPTRIVATEWIRGYVHPTYPEGVPETDADPISLQRGVKGSRSGIFTASLHSKVAVCHPVVLLSELPEMKFSQPALHPSREGPF